MARTPAPPPDDRSSFARSRRRATRFLGLLALAVLGISAYQGWTALPVEVPEAVLTRALEELPPGHAVAATRGSRGPAGLRIAVRARTPSGEPVTFLFDADPATGSLVPAGRVYGSLAGLRAVGWWLLVGVSGGYLVLLRFLPWLLVPKCPRHWGTAMQRSEELLYPGGWDERSLPLPPIALVRDVCPHGDYARRRVRIPAEYRPGPASTPLQIGSGGSGFWEFGRWGVFLTRPLYWWIRPDPGRATPAVPLGPRFPEEPLNPEAHPGPRTQDAWDALFRHLKATLEGEEVNP